MQKPRMSALVLAFATALCGVEVAQGYSAQPLRAQRVRGGGGVDSQGGLSLVETSSNSTNEMSIATLEKNINHENVDQTPFMRYAVTPKPFVDHANINPKRCPTGDSLVGCFIDTQTEHQRYYNEHVPREDRELMTPEVCYRFCLNASGVQFFGLRRGDECYCTPFFHDTGKLGRGECDMPCVGDQSQMCGGEEKANIYEMHDCNNLPALRCRNPPPAVEHAKHYGSNYYRKTGTPCANSKQGALTNENSHCEIECETGYELTENTIECVEKGDRLSYSWATIEGKAVCSPVPCGLPPTVEAANHIPVPKFFPENTTYTCLTGYTTNELHDGPKEFDTTCQADQQFSTPVGCHKVICYKCPSHKYTHNATQTDDRYFQDDCDYRCQRGFTLDTTPLGPSTFTTSCKADGNFSKPKECKHVSCGPRQTIGHADIVKTGEGEGRKKVMVYMETVDYKCHEGYSLTGQFGGETKQTRECLYTGEYSAFTTCKPVACGYPASVEHSTFDPSPRWYPETVTYTCDYGYTLTGQAGGNIMMTNTCGPEGRFLEQSPQCLPVECGPPPTVELAALNHPGLGPVMVNYASDAIMYTCDAGYSAIDEDDVWTPNKNQFSLTCRADGSFSPAMRCININDCMVQSCGTFGTCVDHPTPTGVHFDDYDCDCRPGYEQTLMQSLVHASEMEKTCTNINDCPRENICGGENIHSISRGACQDKLIDYDCLCSSGYETTKLPALPDNDTCTPVICGPAPKMGFAVSDKDGVVVDYDTPPWTYLCDEGYTIDGLPMGPKTTVKSCTSGATISAGPDACLPVTCGSTHSAPHADMSPPLMEIHYDEELTYTCEVGYTLDAKVGGVDNWKVNCMANGTQTPMSVCLPVECGIPGPTTGAEEYATYVPAKAGILVFKEVARIVCDYGYSLDQSTTPSMAEYEVTCLSNGTFGYLRKCKPILCGVPPDVMHSSKTVHSPMVFPEDLEYTCDYGYSLNGNVTGEMKHEVTCQANGTFSPTKACMPVTCGRSPRLENATYPGTSHVYLERALYRCLEGFSTDGKADGPKSFALNCAGTGEFVGLDGCKPIECGKVEKRDFALQIPVGAEALSTLVYAQIAMFECEPGYNRDGRYLSTHVFATVRCQADGTMTNPSPCVNLDDCSSPENKCATKVQGPDVLMRGAGVCVDHEKPTGEHMEDFSCACDSGFAENVTANARYCYNVPDCPLDPVVACLPGTCHDLINNYYCNCPSGYYEGRNAEDNLIHDCLPVYCGAPPTVEFATTPTTADQYFDMPILNYTCDTGYTLDGIASGVTTFSLKCHANRSFTRAPTCLPVACGDAPHVHNSSYPAGPKVFPEEVHYQCNAGFSLDATYDGVTNKQFKSDCQADGTFSPVKPCLNIKCPALNKQKYTVNDDSGTILAYPAMLRKTCMAGYALDAFQHQAMTYNIYCNTEGVLIGGGRPDTAVADWRQCTPINCGAFPTIAQASVSGSQYYSETATVQCNTGYSVDQTVVPASAWYIIRCQTTGNYNTHPDCLPVSCGSSAYVSKTTRSDEGEKFYTETVTYTLDTGYTLNAEASGPKSFTTTCQADGNFTPTQMPHPVDCGGAPVKENAAYPGSTHTYLQEEPYRCSTGYSMDSRAWIDGGANAFNLTCKEDGDYHWLDGDADKPHSDAFCQKVSCGVPQAPSHSNPGRTAVNENKFQDRPDFTCKPGYSLNGTLAGLTSYTIGCRANGTFEPHNGCINMDDCEGNACVPHGRCVDFENPTGNHLRDYTCDCDSGYELKDDEVTGEHYCGNIPDCPEGACLPGSCQDLVNDYKCHCPAGYYEGENVEREWAHDCLPMSCGTPPTVEHATTEETTREVFYASDDVPYTCNEGYSLDASPPRPAAETLFLTASNGGDWHTLRCGSGQKIIGGGCNAHSGPWVFEYNGPDGDGAWKCGGQGGAKTVYAICSSHITPEIVHVNGGDWTTVGCPAGKKIVGGGCQANGSPHLMQQSSPDGDSAWKCGGQGGPKSVWAACSDSVEPTIVHVDGGDWTTATCPEGMRVLAGGCNANGHPYRMQYNGPDGNNRWKCGGSGSPKSVWAICAEPTRDEEDFSLTCTTTGDFSSPPVCLPVECGIAPAVESTTVDDASKTWVFQEEPKYTCAEGFSVGGNAGDPTEFKAQCTSAGTFTGMQACEANGCPLPEGSDPFGPHATYDAAAVPTVYPNNVQLTCLPGYALPEPAGTEFLQLPPKSPHHSSSAAAAAKAKGARKPLHPKLQKVVTKLTGRRLDKIQVTKTQAKTQVSKRQRMIQSRKVVSRRNHRSHMHANRSATRGVNAHLSISDVTVAHNNLAGVGPDSGAQELRYENVGHVDGQQIDLIVTAGNNYERKGSASSGLNSAFGKIHIKTCILVDFTFMFVDHATDQPVTLNAFDITWFDLDKGATTNKIEEIVMYDYDRMYTHVAPWYSVHETSDGGEELIATHVNVDNPHDPMTLTENQMQASVAFRFVNVHTFHATMGSVCTNNANSGRNFNFAFESAMVPERDVTYLVTCKSDGSYEIPTDLCEPIDCGQAPTVEHATVTGGTKYGETLTVTAADGYSLDGSASPAAKVYNITCQDTGDFTPTYPLQPIICGESPNMQSESKDSNSEKVFEDVVHYALNRGYTLDGQADGETAYDVTCQADGQFSALEAAVPVDCGAPPVLEHASTPASTYVFGGVAAYNCAGGHSVDGTASGATTFDLTCGADGTFGSPTGCQPIMCGAVTFPANVEQLPDGSGELHTSLHFGQVATFRCLKGFSKDGVLGSTDLEYSVSCQASGENLYPATCQNIDDCTARDQMCGPNGHCQDHENPTGEHWDDFSCVCNSGFSAEVVESAKTCVNIDDCPPDGCAPGSCTDLVNAYECTCPLGYRVGSGPSCTPVSCGVPPAEANAAFSSASGRTTELFYTGAPVGYTCNDGYTLDASPVGDKSFNVSCLPTGSLEEADTCLPVGCGKAPIGNFTTPGFVEDRTFTFGQTAGYTCETGYSLDGTAAGQRTFDATCQADGMFGGVEVCEPVACAVPMTRGMVDPQAFGANAAFNDVAALSFHYPQAVVVECLPGFEQRRQASIVFGVAGAEGANVWDGTPASALNGEWTKGSDRNGKPTYHNSNGGVIQWEAGSDWGAIHMGQGGVPKWTAGILGHHRYWNDATTDVAPESGWVARAETASGSFTISWHTASGAHATNYTVSCEATGAYSVPSDQCTAISCGDAPCITNGDVTGSTFFGGTLTATAHDGYSLDGSTATDMKSFTYQCQASGQFSSVREFQKVSCGVAPDVDHVETVDLIAGATTPPCAEGGSAAAVLLQEDAKNATRPQSMARRLMVRKVESQKAVTNEHSANATGSVHMAVRKIYNTRRHRVNNTLRRAKTALAPVYGDELEYTCAEGYHVRMREGDVLDSDPKKFKYTCRSDGDLATTTPSGMLSPECVPITCHIPPSGPEASLFYSAQNGGDWHTVRCSSGQKVVGGGCNARDGPWVMEKNGPEGADGWTCGGHGGGKTVWAMCSSRISPEIVGSQGGDWHSVSCPAGKKVISGGCHANGSPHQAQYNGPDGDSTWKCGGHGGPKYVHAICSSQIDVHIVAVNTGDWGDAYCPSGMQVIGGGCNAYGHPYRFQYNGPDGENKWKCGGHGGPKTVWAMCVAINEAAEQFPNVHHSDSFKRNFGETVPMLCGEGYSLDGLPSGQVAFEESCLESGTLSRDNQCVDIDWCSISRCGDHGTCVDGVTGYTCQCEVGFEVTITDGHLESCVQIDECETMSGNLLCGGRSSECGTCVDGTLGYNCSCAEGYESEHLDDGRDQCVRITCDAPFELIHEGLDCQPSSNWLGLQSAESCAETASSRGCSAFAHVTRGDENCKCCNDGYEASAGDPNIDIYSVGQAIPDRPHSSTPMAGRKLSYEGTAIFNCDSGYTLDGTAAGGTDYTVTCNANKQLSGFEDCRPVECGALPAVQDATTDATSLVYGETARYTCAEDHTLNAQAGGPTSFDVGCTAAGSLTETYPCHLISCGVPTRPPYAGVSSDEKFVGDITTVECVEGYSLDASADGPKSFTLTCEANGTFTGMQSCTKVSCGVPRKVENSQMPVSEFFYQDQFDIVCHCGYSEDHTTTGADAFTATCEADGTLSGVGQCLPVSCGTPSGTTESTYDGGELFLDDVANFSCKEGYSTTGTTVGGEWYIKTCNRVGQLSRASPGLCVDINYCTTNPCGANGICTDSGVGIPFPGYSCSCLEGYEITQRSDGGQTCSADDCAGNPCGSGGTCTDLSAQGGPQGAYQCNCETGYDLIEETPGQSTCRRAVCGPLPANIQDVVKDERTNLPVVAIDIYKGRQTYSTMTGAPILKSFDVATYTCETGYSTDGLVGVESSTFSVTCLGSGVFSRTLQPTLECQPVQCANYQNLRMPNSHIIRQRTVYVYGQSIEYECATGHTLNGEIGGPASYTVPCRADGTFPDSQTSCVATTCAVPERPFAAADAHGTVQFGRAITYNCQTGYELGGNGSASFSGTCEADGTVSFSFGIGVCEPVSCGLLEQPTNADVLTYSTSSSSLSSVTMKSERGPDWHTLSCDAGTKLIGGGCDGNSPPHRYEVSNPESDTTWRCGGSGAGKTIHVICSPLVTPEIVSVNTGDWGTVTCPAGKKVLSGGCHAAGHPYIMQQNSPDGDNRWKCGGQGGPKRIWAVCSDIVEPTIVRAEGGDWVVAQCPSGMKVIGGGCNARSSPHVFSWNAPENDHAWKCGGHGSSKEAWAVCASAVPTYTPMRTGYEGTYGAPPARVVCRPGMTLGGVAGGATFYSTSCGADKAYSNTASGVCETIKYAVGGLLTDAQSPSIRLSGATVTVRSVDGVNVVGTATSATSGIYWVDLPLGRWTFTVVKDGYITTARNISIAGYTGTGGAADMSLSQVLGEGEWRVVVEWDQHSRDIDSHTYWNNNAAHVYWARRSALDHSSNIHVVLDRDDVSGYGPETTSFSGIGECEVTSQCLVKFEIDNYTPNDGCLGNSDVHIKLYQGDRMYAEYRIPECAGCPGRGHHWPVFTLDARVGHEAAYAGPKRLPPYLEGAGQVDWSQTFDTQMWNMAPTGTLLTGFRAQALSNGGGRPEDAPVYTHISLFNADVVHNNLFGTGPDSGAEELRYHNVGNFGDRTFDLVITGTSGNYARSSTGSNGKSGDFGKINLRGCHAAEFDFTIVDAATGNPATIASFDITFFDLDDWNRHRKREIIRVNNYDSMTVAPDPVVAITTERDGSITARAQENGLPNPSDPMTLTSEQMAGSVAFTFSMRSGFHTTLGSECDSGSSSGGRNLMFSFDSAMSPPDPGYQTALQYIHQIQYAETISVGGLQGHYLDCEQVDFDLTAVGWAVCPEGKFLDGLYRVGSRYSEGDGPQQITRGSCCKAIDMPAEYGSCTEESIFREANVMYQCPSRTAVVGIHRGAMHDTLDDIDKMRCCAFQAMALLDDGPAQCTD